MKDTFSLIIMMFLFIMLMQCKMPSPPAGEEFMIYSDHLTSGFDIGIESSEKQRDWLHEESGIMQMAYPSGQKSGSVFVVAGTVTFEQVAEDLSRFSALAVDLKGACGGEWIQLAIEDIEHSFTKSQFIFDLDTQWQTYYFSLSDFGQINLQKVHVVANFLFAGNRSQTVYFKKLRYLKGGVDISQRQPFYVFWCNAIPPNYDIFTAKDSLSSNPEPIELDVSDGILKIVSPSGNQWTTVFFMHKDAVPQDLSDYHSIEFEIQDATGEEAVHIGVKDSKEPTKYVKIDVSSEWNRYTLPVSYFKPSDFSRLVIVFAIKFEGAKTYPQTVNIRNIKYEF